MMPSHPETGPGLATPTGDALDAASRLALVARSLNGRCTIDDIVDTVLQQGMALLHADGAVFAIERGAHLHPLAVRGASLEVFANIGLIPLVAELPIARAAHAGAAIWLRDAAVTAAEFPLLRHIAPGVEAWAALPVEFEGDQVGVFGFCFRRPQPFDEVHRLYARTLTDMSARPLRAALVGVEPSDRPVATSSEGDRIDFIHRHQTVSELACALLALGMLGPDATGVSIAALVTPDELAFLATAGYIGDVHSTRTLRLPVDHPSPMTRSVATRTAIAMRTRSDLVELSPEFAAIAPDAEAAIAIPAIHDCSVLGSIGITFAARQSFDAACVAGLTAIAAGIARHVLEPITRLVDESVV